MESQYPRIPVLDLAPEIESLRAELKEAIDNVLDGCHFIMGPNVKAFEAEAAAYLRVRHAIALNSGTDALVIAADALNLREGDEVITTPFTFFATGEALSHFGAKPVFVDIDPDTFNMDVGQIESRITGRTKAILPVHLFGQSVDMDPLLQVAKRHGLFVIEDVAQAFGADYSGKKLGALGDVGAFSFFPSKNLGAFGDGGMLVTDDDALAERARMLRVHGARKKYHNELVGYNSRLDELQAAILRVKLPHVDEANEGRLRAAETYDRLLGGIPGLTIPKRAADRTHVYHQYTVRISNSRDRVQKLLEDAGIGTMVYYPVPMHRLPVYEHLQAGGLPETERAAAEVLSLPIWPTIRQDQQERVASALAAALQEVRPLAGAV